MAVYTVTPGQVGCHAKTLVANAVDTVTFTTGDEHTAGWANVPKAVEILTNGAADIYVTVDGSAPTVAGPQCYRLPAAAGAAVFSVRDSNPVDAVVVKLISPGVPEYSVSRAG